MPDEEEHVEAAQQDRLDGEEIAGDHAGCLRAQELTPARPAATRRRQLIELYARGLELEIANLDEAVARTAGATASFFKELLRKASLTALEAGHTEVTDADFTSALDELLDDTSALTRVLLGHGEHLDTPAAPAPREWMARIARIESSHS